MRITSNDIEIIKNMHWRRVVWWRVDSSYTWDITEFDWEIYIDIYNAIYLLSNHHSWGRSWYWPLSWEDNRDNYTHSWMIWNGDRLFEFDYLDIKENFTHLNKYKLWA